MTPMTIMIIYPLITASIQKGSIDILSKALQENPALAEGDAKEGVSLLLFAAYCKNQPAVNLLKKYRTSLNIYEAVCTGEIEIVKALLDERPEELSIPSADGFSLLGYACFFNQPAIARYLIVEKEADVNQPSANALKVTPTSMQQRMRARRHCPLPKKAPSSTRQPTSGRRCSGHQMPGESPAD